jgi:hypothetical protein
MKPRTAIMLPGEPGCCEFPNAIELVSRQKRFSNGRDWAIWRWAPLNGYSERDARHHF